MALSAVWRRSFISARTAASLGWVRCPRSCAASAAEVAPGSTPWWSETSLRASRIWAPRWWRCRSPSVWPGDRAKPEEERGVGLLHVRAEVLPGLQAHVLDDVGGIDSPLQPRVEPKAHHPAQPRTDTAAGGPPSSRDHPTRPVSPGLRHRRIRLTWTFPYNLNRGAGRFGNSIAEKNGTRGESSERTGFATWSGLRSDCIISFSRLHSSPLTPRWQLSPPRQGYHPTGRVVLKGGTLIDGSGRRPGRAIWRCGGTGSSPSDRFRSTPGARSSMFLAGGRPGLHRPAHALG